MKQVAGPIRVQLAQYRELESFASFSSDLDAATLSQLALGKSLMNVLRQLPNRPVAVYKQVAVLFAGTQNEFVGIPENDFPKAMAAFYEMIDHSKAGKDYIARFRDNPAMDADLKHLISQLADAALKPYRKKDEAK